jgi:hypothetical protein
MRGGAQGRTNLQLKLAARSLLMVNLMSLKSDRLLALH